MPRQPATERMYPCINIAVITAACWRRWSMCKVTISSMETSTTKRRSLRTWSPSVPSRCPPLKRQAPNLVPLLQVSEVPEEAVDRDVVEDWIAKMSPVDTVGDGGVRSPAPSSGETRKAIADKETASLQGDRSHRSGCQSRNDEPA